MRYHADNDHESPEDDPGTLTSEARTVLWGIGLILGSAVLALIGGALLVVLIR